jgi:hypothetical protein
MSQFDVDQMIEGVRAQLEAQGQKLQGLSLEDLRDAISHPKAAEEIARLMALEASSVQVGDPAPDFRLPRLGDAQAGEPVTLSSNFGNRPVGLIFGSYT